MKLTTKRDWWYFWRELFLYIVPMILIIWTVDVFFSFIQCPLHPEYSAPCNIIWINAIGYWIFFIVAVIFAIFSAKKLRKVKRKIENEFLEAVEHTEHERNNKDEELNPKNVEVDDIKRWKNIVKSNKKQTTKKNWDKKNINHSKNEKKISKRSSTRTKTSEKK